MKILTRRLILLASAGLLIALGVAGCTKNAFDPKSNTYRGILADDVKTWDPANAYDEISWTVIPQVYETLYQYDFLSVQYKIIPLLAADLPTLSPDRLTVTIRIRPDVKFQDSEAFSVGKGSSSAGRKLSAKDFIYAFKRLALPSLNSGGWWLFDGKVKGMTEFHDKLAKAKYAEERKEIFDGPVEGLEAIDDLTLRIKLVKPYPQLIYVMAMPFTSPVPHEAVEKFGDKDGNLNDTPVGTGPFILKDYQRGNKLVMIRNPNFRGETYPTRGDDKFVQEGMLADAGKPLPFIDRAEWSIVKETQPSWLKFMKGETEVLGIPKDNFSSAMSTQSELTPDLKNKGIKLIIDSGVGYFNIAINMKDKLLGENKFLRQAISCSLDRAKWIELFTNGRGKKQVTALPEGITGRPANSKIKYDFDIARAKELLKKAGFPDGKGLPKIHFDMRGADSVSRQMGEYFTAQMAQTGIQLDVIYNTFPAFLEKAKSGNLQLSLGGWIMDYPDAENVYQLLYGPNGAPGPNDSNFNDPKMNALYLKMAAAQDGPDRTKLIQEMDDLLQEEVPWALGYFPIDYRLQHPWVHNYRPADMILNRLKYMRIDGAERAKRLGGD